MRWRKALLDFSLLLPTIIFAISVIISSYLAYGQIASAIKELIKEASKNALVVQPYYDPRLKACGCQVSAIHQK